jgi:hypothetical protein
MYWLRCAVATEVRRLLRVLLLWVGALPTDSGGTCRRNRLCFLPHRLAMMDSDTLQRSRDWLGSARMYVPAWWIPKAVILAGLFAPPLARTVMWIIELAWMGTACILNSRRCGRTHCRYASTRGVPVNSVGNPSRGRQRGRVDFLPHELAIYGQRHRPMLARLAQQPTRQRLA